ncbi:MAG: PEP-CTERM sorting domain-containing protein [Pirellulaceae bacterium]|nr:PEP-CTERM sorting domain-containing protein [Pirellulaceae bacterium]
MIHPEDQTRCNLSVCPACDLSRPLLKAIRKMALGVVFVALVLQVGAASGQIFSTWNGTSGWYDLGGNWSNGTPGILDTAQISTGTSTAQWDSVTGNRSLHRLSVTGGNTTFESTDSTQYVLSIHRELFDAFNVSGSGTFFMVRGLHFNLVNGGAIIYSGATLTLDGDHGAGTRLTVKTNLENRGTINLTSGAIGTVQGTTYVGIIPGDPQANLNVLSGSQLNTSTSYLGWNSGSSGRVTVDGAGSVWNNSSDLYVGRSGSGTLNLLGGGVATSSNGYLGLNSGSSGTATVEGTNSRWSISNNLHVGWDSPTASGTLNVNSSGRVHVGDSTTGTGMGIYVGHATSSTTAGNVRVGANSTVTNGGFVTVGQSNGTFGSATVSGANAVWNNSGAALIGEIGTGTLTVSNGGVFSNSDASVGTFSSGNGTATVSGAGSQWNSSGLLTIGSSGTGTLNVQSAGVVTSTNGFVGRNSGSTGTATITGAGSQWNNSGSLTVGNSGTGTLNVQSAGVVTSTNGFVGFNAGSTGTATITGANSRWSVGNNLHVGWDITSASGILNVNSNGRVHVGNSTSGSGMGIYIGHTTNTSTSGNLRVGANSTVTNGGWATVGQGNGTFGSATVSGANAVWNNSGNVWIGELGTGTLTVSSGGVFSNFNGIVGSTSSANGTATVSGAGSEWNNSGSLTVGGSGTGTLNVQSAGVVTSTNGVVGLSGGSTGTATIAGAGSQWNNSGSLTLGNSGTGTLSIQLGGQVSNTSGFLGFQNGSDGTATVTGAGSQWNNSGNLTVGGSGTGILNLVNNGLVSVGGTTSIGDLGTINLNGGRLEFGTMSLNHFAAINKNSGSLAGALNHSGYTNVSSLSALNAVSGVDMTEVNLTNSGTLFGNATLGVSILNTANGELEASAGERLRFAGNLTNAGELNAFGGQLRFDGSGINSNEINNFNGVFRVGQEMVNQSSGFIGGRGQFIANGGWENHGAMVFSSGTSDVLGHIENFSGALIVTTGGGTTTFHNNVLHNGAEIRTAANSGTVILGDWTGAGAFTGTGTVYLEGGVHPGNSPDIVSFGGNLVLGLNSATFIELGGLLDGQYDRFQIAGDLSVNGSLNVSLIDGFELGFNQVFSVMQAGGASTGMFAGLGEGALVGNFGGMDLFITYNPGGGNGVSLFTAVPEPSSAMLVGLTLLGLSFRVRRRSVAAT